MRKLNLFFLDPIWGRAPEGANDVSRNVTCTSPPKKTVGLWRKCEQIFAKSLSFMNTLVYIPFCCENFANKYERKISSTPPPPRGKLSCSSHMFIFNINFLRLILPLFPLPAADLLFPIPPSRSSQRFHPHPRFLAHLHIQSLSKLEYNPEFQTVIISRTP